MIVTCQNCETSFQLDESRVPPQGIRVRCSRCKEAFFLPHPAASADDAVHGIAEEAAGGITSPGPARDLSASGARRPGAAASGAPAEDDDEHDWEFNLDPPRTEPDAADSGAAAPAATDGLAERDDAARATASTPGASSGLSLVGEDEEAGGPAAEGESDFGSVDDYSSLMEEDDEEAVAGLDLDGLHGAAEPLEEGAGDGAEAGRYAGSGASDDLGDPESWDFFGGAEGGSSEARVAGSGAVLGRIPLASAPAGQTGGLADDLGPAAWDDDADVEPEQMSAPGPVLRAIGDAGQGVGWVITLGLVGVALVAGFRGTADSLVRSPVELRVGRLEAQDVRTRWVDDARGETHLVVRGRLVAPRGAFGETVGTLEVGLRDAAGRPLPGAIRPAGVPLAAAELRELDPDGLRIALDRAAWRLSRTALQPGEPLAFEAVFTDAPPGAARVALARADESAGPGLGAPAEPVVPAASADAPVQLEGAARLAPAVPAPREDAPARDATSAGSAARSAGATGGLPDELTWGE